ncbi:MAG: 30S ribosomal protein S6 [Candidatus Binataceae bacterium]
MRRYETVFILRPDLGEPAQKEAIKRFEGLIGTSGGDLIDTDEWGFRELAYRIRGERRGYYVRLDYGGNGATMNEVERNLKLSDKVLRHLSVLVEAEADPAKIRADIEAHRRRAAEARAAAEAKAAAAAENAARAQQAENPPAQPSEPDAKDEPIASAEPAPATSEPESAASPVSENPEAPSPGTNEPESGNQG